MDIFSNVRIGLRLCLALGAEDLEQFGFGAGYSAGDFIFDMNNAGAAISEQTILQEKAFIVEGVDGDTFLTPLAATEIDLVLDSYPTAQNLADLAGGELAKNMGCLLENLADTDQYKMIFETCIPLKKMASWLAIYNIMNFLPAMGWAQDGWNKQGGRWMGFFSGFRTWNRKTFEDSKNQARRVFLSYYHGQDLEWKPEELDSAGKMKNRKKIDIQLDIKWWKLSREVRKPTDKNDELCP